MDRRRRRFVFAPRAEGLEGRSLLSAAPAAPPEVAAQVAPAAPPDSTPGPEAQSGPVVRQQQAATPRVRADRPEEGLLGTMARRQQQEQSREEIIQTRLQRIDRLPAFLQVLDPGRTIPEAAMQQIQDDLRSLIDTLRPPGEPVARQFIEFLRDAMTYRSIRPESAAALNSSFGQVLRSAGAPESTVASLRASMNTLAQAATFESNPVVLMTNDYAIVLQTAMGVGRPIGPVARPGAPQR